MKRYQVRITETLERVVEVDAEDWADAKAKVKHWYDTEDIVLDSNDFQGVEIEAIWEE